MRENSILIHLIFIYFNCLPDDVLCKFAIWACDTENENENVFILMNFTENVPWNQTFPCLFIVISSSFVYKEVMHTQKFKN